MPDFSVTKRTDPLTNSSRRVEGDQRVISGTLRQPQNKYATGGFTVTPASLGFDKGIRDLVVMPDKENKVTPAVERVSASEWKVRFFSAIGTELANESETPKEKDFPFIAWGE